MGPQGIFKPVGDSQKRRQVVGVEDDGESEGGAGPSSSESGRAGRCPGRSGSGAAAVTLHPHPPHATLLWLFNRRPCCCPQMRVARWTSGGCACTSGPSCATTTQSSPATRRVSAPGGGGAACNTPARALPAWCDDALLTCCAPLGCSFPCRSHC